MSIKPAQTQKRILVTGSLGQIGTELVSRLRKAYGPENVIASDIKKPSKNHFSIDGPFEYGDVTNIDTLAQLIVKHNIDTVFHLATVLSALGEKMPDVALKVNATGIQNVLELSKSHKFQVIAPSTIAAFGPQTPKEQTPDITVQRPTTIYGVTKVYTELLGEYYQKRFGVDFRSLRLPGIISSEALPGGGTTDYAIEIFYEALTKGQYTYLSEVPENRLSQRTYNITAMSFTPKELADSIRKVKMPRFSISYNPDFRQKIADTWPKSIDDSIARRDWKWRPDYALDEMVKDMFEKLEPKVKKN
ncbi:l-threonine 3-dehydrogenase [Anaeramoeba ignava]|uniref:L-threonine 3-dehydrogenase n=1 Tax=Anaeramoeba ignava TaxID=1746090 RepID=A0A9Q0L5D7_ANAIG|nr:l-threonine 3-dehydrogenase [Anaeramoeba ignava]